MNRLIDRIIEAVAASDRAQAAAGAASETARQRLERHTVAALCAMREPSPEMLAAAWKAFSRGREGMPFLQYLGEGSAFKEAMIAMLQSALTE